MLKSGLFSTLPKPDKHSGKNSWILPPFRFEGPEQPIIDERIGITDTLGISLHPEYSVYSTEASTASFVFAKSRKQEHNVWRALFHYL